MTTPDHLDAEARTVAGAIALLFAVGMHLVVGAFVLMSGRIAPFWAFAALAVAWLGLGAAIWRWHRRRPLVTLLVPFVAAGLLWLVLTVGSHAFGWAT